MVLGMGDRDALLPRLRTQEHGLGRVAWIQKQLSTTLSMTPTRSDKGTLRIDERGRSQNSSHLSSVHILYTLLGLALKDHREQVCWFSAVGMVAFEIRQPKLFLVLSEQRVT
jgi:hypothetical protein